MSARMPTQSFFPFSYAQRNSTRLHPGPSPAAFPSSCCSESGELPHFQFVEINGLRLPSPQHAYSALYEVSLRMCGVWGRGIFDLLLLSHLCCLSPTPPTKTAHQQPNEAYPKTPSRPAAAPPLLSLPCLPTGAHRRPCGATDGCQRAGGDVQWRRRQERQRQAASHHRAGG